MLVGADQGHSYLGQLVLCIAPPSKVLDDAMQRLVCRAASRRAAHACSTASRQPHLGSLSLAGGSSRHAAFTTAAARDPHAVLGLSVGATEAEAGTANVRTRDNEVHGTKSIDDLIAEFTQMTVDHK